MYRFYYCPVTASMAPHSVLEETGAEFEQVEIDITATPEGYEAKHPLRRVPVLEDGDLTLYESAAIIMHLCDRHPEMDLAPPLGDPQRPLYYQWLIFGPAHIHAATKTFNYAYRYTSDEACIPSVQTQSARNVNELFEIIEGWFGDGPWVLGDRFKRLRSLLAHVLHLGGRRLRAGLAQSDLDLSDLGALRRAGAGTSRHPAHAEDPWRHLIRRRKE